MAIDELKQIDPVVGTEQDENTIQPDSRAVLGKWLIVAGLGIALAFILYIVVYS